MPSVAAESSYDGPLLGVLLWTTVEPEQTRKLGRIFREKEDVRVEGDFVTIYHRRP